MDLGAARKKLKPPCRRHDDLRANVDGAARGFAQARGTRFADQNGMSSSSKLSAGGAWREGALDCGARAGAPERSPRP